MEIWLVVLAYLAIINIVTALAFSWDKQMAITGGWRISEATLLFLVFLGGGFGAKYGQIIYRHKTRKQPFKSMLNLILVVNLIGMVVLILPDARAQVMRMGEAIIADDWQSSNSGSERRKPRRFGPGS